MKITLNTIFIKLDIRIIIRQVKYKSKIKQIQEL